MTSSAPMTIYPKDGRLYCKLKQQGRWVPRALGLDDTPENRKKAAKLADKMQELLDAGHPIDSKITVRAWSKRWLEKRRERDLTMADDDESRLDVHILPALGDVPLADLRARHIRAFVHRLRTKPLAKKRGDAKRLAPRTVLHVWGTLRQLVRAALAEGLLDADPCVLMPGDLPEKLDRDPGWRDTALFTRAEAELLMSAEAIPAERRFLYAVLLLAGLRYSEAAALRWQDWDRTARPLGRLSVSRAYSTHLRRFQGTKTGVGRAVPVHAELARLLAAEKVRRRPEPEDLLFPGDEGGPVSVYVAGDRWAEDLAALKLRMRRIHDTRRTFVTLALEDGARREDLRWATHGGTRQEVMDLYRTMRWPVLCEAVSCLKLKTGGAGKVVQMKRRKG